MNMGKKSIIKEDKFSDVYDIGEEFAKILDIKNNEDVYKMLHKDNNKSEIRELMEYNRKIIKENEFSDKEVSDIVNKICKKRSLDLEKLRSNLSTPISSEKALKDILPFEWSNEVLSGKKKVTIGLADESEE